MKIPSFKPVVVLAAIALYALAAVPSRAGTGYALSFNGTNSFVRVPCMVSNDFTIAFWMCSTQSTNMGAQWWKGIGLVDASVPGHTNDFGFSLGYSGRVGFGAEGANGPTIYSDATALVSDGLWHHVAATRMRSDGGMWLYVDGVLKSSAPGPTIILNAPTHMHVGCLATTNNFFRGQLDEVRIWRRALSVAEIRTNMYSMANVVDTNLVACWPFNEGSGTGTTADISGNGFDGALAGSPAWVVSGVPFPPDVTTTPTSSLVSNTLSGTINPGNLPAIAWFEYGLTTNYGASTAPVVFVATNATFDVGVTLTNLAFPDVWHFRLTASNSLGVVHGGDRMFPSRTNAVTTLADSGAGSLRQAIADSLDGETIVIRTGGTIALTNGELVVSNRLAIIGPGATNLAISGCGSNRVFNISSNATVTISDISICNGKAPNGSAGSNAGPGVSGSHGGGIFNAGYLEMIRSTIVNNHAGAGGRGGNGGTGGRGGIGGRGGRGADGGNGGGVYNTGSLILTSCIFASNTAGGGGDGGNGGSCDAAGLGGSGGNGGTGGIGGGVYSAGSLSLSSCTFDSNTAGKGGNGGPAGDGGDGGTGGTGGNGSAGGASGGVYCLSNFTLASCTFSSNSAGSGGNGGAGGYGYNTAGVAGNGSDGGTGGGVCGMGGFTMISCTVSGNSAGAGGTGGAGGNGGPNAASGGHGGVGGNGGVGGGLVATPGSLRNSLLALNTAGLGGSGGTGGTAPHGTVGATGSTGTNGWDPDIAGAFSSQGYNLVGQAADSLGLVNGADHDVVGSSNAPVIPLLGPLGDYGGATPAIPLQPGSPAINAGDDSVAGGVDQRGFARQTGPHVDIGAYELNLLQITAPTCTVSNLSSGFSSATFAISGVFYGVATMATLEYGITAAYGAAAAPITIGYGCNQASSNVTLTGLAPGTRYHFRLSASNPAGTVTGPDQTFLTTPVGDLNGDGVVSADEAAGVMDNYWSAGTNYLTGMRNMGQGQFAFGLSNAAGLDFTVMVSTNLAEWRVLSNAAPEFLLHDDTATNAPQRYYRLRWP